MLVALGPSPCPSSPLDLVRLDGRVLLRPNPSPWHSRSSKVTLLAPVPPVYPSRRLCLLLCDLELPLLQLVHDCHLDELDLVGDILVLGLLELLLLVKSLVNNCSSVLYRV